MKHSEESPSFLNELIGRVAGTAISIVLLPFLYPLILIAALAVVLPCLVFLDWIHSSGPHETAEAQHHAHAPHDAAPEPAAPTLSLRDRDNERLGIPASRIGPSNPAPSEVSEAGAPINETPIREAPVREAPRMHR